jgi:hypothetical protein
VEWVLWNENGSVVGEGEWMSRGSRWCASGGEGKGKSTVQREQDRGKWSLKTTSTDGYGSDNEDPDNGGAASDGGSNSSGRSRGSVRSEKEWFGWMGYLRCQPRVAADEHICMSIITVYYCLMNICFTSGCSAALQPRIPFLSCGLHLF